MRPEPPDWVDYWSLAIAAAALLASLVSLFISWRAQRISERAEKRTQPRFGVQLLQCESLTDRRNHTRQFHIEVQISNRSDSDNAIARLELLVGYDVAGAPVSYKLPLDTCPTLPAPSPTLRTPMKLSAHETLQGWCVFELDKSAVGSRNFDSYELIIEDNYGNSNKMPIETISESLVSA